MDNNNEDDVQNVDKEAANVVTDCLCNSVVVRTILEHFSSPELRQLSFVNKIWKDEAQSVMRQRGHFTAHVKGHGHGPRGKVDEFISDLKQMNPVPFSGINIHLYYEPCFGPCPVLPLDPLEGVTLDETLLKTLSVQLRGSWSINLASPSPAVLLTKKLLQDCSVVLEELSLNVDFDGEEFIEKVVQDVTFPRLKILKLIDTTNIYYISDEAGDENYLKTMVSRAPNLKVLHSDRPINWVLDVLEGRSVMPVYTRRVSAPFEDVSESVIGAIKLENMELMYPYSSLNLERFNRIAPLLLQESCTTTLRAMWIDPVLAVPLMNYGISLKNVKYLSMDLNFKNLEDVQRRILNIVKNFNFTEIFPNLNRVEIAAPNLTSHIQPDHMDEIINQANAVLTDPTPDRAANVKTLCLQESIISNEAVQFLADMFPNIEKLDISHQATAEAEPLPFASIFERWVDLKELQVQGNMLPTDKNLDSVFCGIFPEEVAELRLMDEDYLARVNIVPVMPALAFLKNLKVLSLNFDERHYYDALHDDATFMFSKVTAFLAFARMPDLAVRFNIYYWCDPPAMTDLEPYVSITYHELEHEIELHDDDDGVDLG